MKKNSKIVENLEEKLRSVNQQIMDMIDNAGSGHTISSLSSARIIITLYYVKMCHNPKNPNWEDRDRFILSKGHAAPALYAVLAETGYFSMNKLSELRKLDGFLQGHPDMRTPGVELSTGSLGQGLSVANGMAISAKLDKKNHRIYVLLGDGECDEGQIWEAAMTSAHHRLNNITAIVDRNYRQNSGLTENIMKKNPLTHKWESFGWNVIEINGYDFSEILNAFEQAEKEKEKPTVIISNLENFSEKVENYAR